MGHVWNSTIPRRTPLKQGSRLRLFGRVRQRRRAKGDVYGPYHRYVGTLPCVVGGGGCKGAVAGHHLKTVAAGGKDHGNEVPLCVPHHQTLHIGGRVLFEARFDVDLAEQADRVRQLWEGR